MRRTKNPWIVVIAVICGAIAGGLLGEFLSQYGFFEWMSFGGVEGYREVLSFSPRLDTHIIRLGLDFTLRINFGSILGMIVSFLLFGR